MKKTLALCLLALLLVSAAWYFNTPDSIVAQQHEVAQSLADTEVSHTTPIEFIYGPSASGYSVAQAYFAKEIEAARTTSSSTPDLGVAEVDLNDDGVMEIIAMIQSPGICGTNQCPLAVLMRSEGKWKHISGELTVAQSVTLGESSTNGMRDLIFNIGNPVGSSGTIWKWD